MYPFFEVFPWFYIYTFWLSLTICFFVFLWMLKKLCHRFWINDTFFFNRILWYFLSVFIFSRLFYVISRWNDFKFIKAPLEFFLMSDYNFSLIWAFFWYFLVMFISIVLHSLRSWKYMDVSVLSFLFASVIWYIWAFFGWQVYWKETNFWIEILYTNPFSPVPYEVPVFPLPIVYSIVFFILFCILYMLAMFINVRWVVWYIWLVLIWAVLLVLDNFSWKYDFFKVEFWISFTQIWAIALIILWFYWFYRIYKTPKTIDII
jgi:prolipoprotein diacylglyceryltransferase